MLANANVYGVKPGYFPYDVSSLDYFKAEDEGVYAGFERDWYTSVGSKILWIAILNVINPHFSAFIFWVPLARCLRKRKENKSYLMKELVDLKTPPAFDLGVHMAYLLSALFITLSLSSGLPILLPLCFLTVTFMYWTRKWHF
jgi:hypothetical protein